MVNHQTHKRRYNHERDMNVSRRVLAKRERHEAMGLQFRRLCDTVVAHGQPVTDVPVASSDPISGPKQRVAVLEAALAALKRRRTKRQRSLVAAVEAAVLSHHQSQSPSQSQSPPALIPSVPDVVVVEGLQASTPIKVEATVRGSQKTNEAADSSEYPVSLAGSSTPGSPVVFIEDKFAPAQWPLHYDCGDDFRVLLEDDHQQLIPNIGASC
jgi:hypothetical protein